MIWRVFSELIPDALEETHSDLVVITLAVVAAMTAFLFLVRYGCGLWR